MAEQILALRLRQGQAGRRVVPRLVDVGLSMEVVRPAPDLAAAMDLYAARLLVLAALLRLVQALLRLFLRAGLPRYLPSPVRPQTNLPFLHLGRTCPQCLEPADHRVGLLPDLAGRLLALVGLHLALEALHLYLVAPLLLDPLLLLAKMVAFHLFIMMS
jgi:hypothetical protein